jgi:hypothetical protein
MTIPLMLEWIVVIKRGRRFSESLKRSPLKEPRATNIEDHPAPISLILDGNEMIYENGIWTAGTRSLHPRA